MANIVDPIAIKLCNERVRPSADLMAQAYNLCVSVSDRWTALGSGQTALNQMQLDIRNAADRIIAAFCHVQLTERNWFLSGVSSLFPNDSSPVFDNGNFTAQDASRPALTGAIVFNVINRGTEFQNWLLSVAGAFNGTLQVETATAVGTITGSGNATVTVTAYGMNNSPKAVSVAVTNADTAATWAGKVRTALAADTDVNAFFSVGGASATITLTSRTAIANDTNLNIALANGTSTGITAAPTSANTTAGVAARGGTSWFGTVMQVSSFTNGTIVLSDAQNFLNRCSELKTNYQASSSANLTTLLQAAVNPSKP